MNQCWLSLLMHGYIIRPQATSHYLNRCWLSLLMHGYIIRPQATSHYLNRCWLSLLMHGYIIRPQATSHYLNRCWLSLLMHGYIIWPLGVNSLVCQLQNMPGYFRFNSLWPDEAIWHHRTWSTSFPVLACHLLSSKPIPESALMYWNYTCRKKVSKISKQYKKLFFQ